VDGVTLTLGELAVRFGCSLRGDPNVAVNHVASLESADEAALAFLANAKYRPHLATTRAAAVIVDTATVAACPVAALIAKDPYLTYARVAALLHPQPQFVPGIHITAVVDSSAVIEGSAYIGAHVVIEAGVRIGERTMIGPGCVVGRDVTIGADTRLLAKVSVLDRTVIGDRCVLNPGAVLGSEGFGFAPDKQGWVKVPQLGGVRIGNDVEIGANTTIDRGAIGDTVIEDGVKLDNQIQIAHNVRIGAHTAIAACTGVSGSTTIGKRCMIAGQVGIAGHLSICDNVIVTGKTMVSASIREPGMYSGSLHAEEARKFRRNAARFAQLDELAKELRRLIGKKQKLGGNE